MFDFLGANRKLGYKRKGSRSVDRRAKKSADDYQKSNLKISTYLSKFATL